MKRVAVLAAAVWLAVAPSAAAKPYEFDDDAAMRARLLREIPGLQAALDSGRQYRAGQLLLRWAAVRINWRAGGPELDTWVPSGTVIFDELFAPLRTGVWCAGAARAYQRLLDMFDLGAVRLELKSLEGYTHVTMAVPIRDTPPRRWAILDPTFNLEIADRRGRIVSINEALRAYARRDTSRLRARTGSLARRKVIYVPSEGSVRAVYKRCGEGVRAGGCGLRYFTDHPMVRHYPSGIRGYVAYLSRSSLSGGWYTLPDELYATWRRWSVAGRHGRAVGA